MFLIFFISKSNNSCLYAILIIIINIFIIQLDKCNLIDIMRTACMHKQNYNYASYKLAVHTAHMTEYTSVMHE